MGARRNFRKGWGGQDQKGPRHGENSSKGEISVQCIGEKHGKKAPYSKKKKKISGEATAYYSCPSPRRRP